MRPLLESDGILYTLDVGFDVARYEDSGEPVAVYDGAEFLRPNAFDVRFLSYVAEHGGYEFKVQKYSGVKQRLWELWRTSENENYKKLYEQKRKYYGDVALKLYSNESAFNGSGVVLSPDFLRDQIRQKTQKFVTNESGEYIFRPHFTAMTSSTGRFGSSVYSFVGDLKRFMIAPEGCAIIELDSVCAEFRLLLFLCGELDLVGTADDFWKKLQEMFLSHLGQQEFKLLVNMFIFGAGKDEIDGKIGSGAYEGFLASMRKVFPKTHRFMNFDNPFMSKDDPKIRDMYDREIVIDSNYKKLNGFLKSSQSTNHQLFVNVLIHKLKETNSRVLFTVHDSVFLCIDRSDESIATVISECHSGQYKPIFAIKS